MELKLVLKNAAALSVASVLSKAISAIVGIAVTRYLGPGPFGEYSSAYAFVGTFILFTDFGLSQLMVQDGSRDPEVLPLALGNTLIFRIFMSFLMYIAMLLLMHPAGYNLDIRQMVVILGIGSALNALDASVYNYYQAKQLMYIAAGYQFFSTFLIGALTILVLVFKGNVVTITKAHLATFAFISLLLYLAVRRDMRLRVDLRRLPRMLKRGLGFGISYIFYNIYFQIDSVMLSIMRTPFEVGIYSAAYRLISILLFIPGILTSVLYPVLYQLGVTSQEKHRETIEKIFKVLSAVGIPGSVLLFVLAHPLLNWLYARRFPQSIPVMMILSWFFAMECLSYSLGDILTTTNRQWIRTWIQGLAALGNVLLNLVWIPRYGIYGSSWATIATELFVFGAYYWIVRRQVYRVRIWRQLPVVTGAALVMGVVAFGLRRMHPVVAAAVAGAVYLIILIGLDRDFRRIGAYVWQQGSRLVKV